MLSDGRERNVVSHVHQAIAHFTLNQHNPREPFEALSQAGFGHSRSSSTHMIAVPDASRVPLPESELEARAIAASGTDSGWADPLSLQRIHHLPQAADDRPTNYSNDIVSFVVDEVDVVASEHRLKPIEFSERSRIGRTQTLSLHD